MHNEQQVTPHIYWVGGNDFNSPRFENLIPLKSGVTYNSYFIDDEKTAVIDTTDTVIRDLFIGNVSHLLHGRKLDYIVVNHRSLEETQLVHAKIDDELFVGCNVSFRHGYLEVLSKHLECLRRSHDLCFWVCHGKRQKGPAVIGFHMVDHDGSLAGSHLHV